MSLDEARRQLHALARSLREMTNRDPEQDVLGPAIPVIDTVLTEASRYVNSEVWSTVRNVISVENIADGTPIRAAELRIIVEAMLNALPAREFRQNDVPSWIADLGGRSRGR